MMVLAAVCGVIVGNLIIGCQQSAPTSRPQMHDLPESYAAAVAEIKVLRDSIRETLASDSPEDADTELHEVGHLLEHLPELSTDVTLPEGADAKIKEAVNQLLDAYGKLDVFHGGDAKEVTYDDVADTIESNIETLEQYAGAENAQQGTDVDANGAEGDSTTEEPAE
jgi:hypothetical protein